VSDFFENLGKSLFGKGGKAKRDDVKPRKAAGTEAASKQAKGTSPTKSKSKAGRGSYFVQVGFDFGTAFSKCVCRDVLLDKAWIHQPPGNENAEMPFLLANAVGYNGRHFKHLHSADGSYQKGGLYHVKMALQKIGLGDLDDPVLAAYREALPQSLINDLPAFVECCAVYLLGGAFGDIKADIAQRFPGTVEGDYTAINMAVPVADADHPAVNHVFDRVLRYAWVLAEDLAGHPQISLAWLKSAINAKAAEAESESVLEACFIYPEVSANVQGFVRSRTSSPGLYLFSDTGAGTVDQSVFLFAKPDGQDHLTYLHADVLSLGSSHIERIAADQDRDNSWLNLERWRQLKESGHSDKALEKARQSIQEQLLKGTTRTIALSKQKLICKDQINQIRVIFGGGGHCEMPYRSGVLSVFDQRIFRDLEIENRRRKRDLFDIGMPHPRDLRLNENQKRWMNRLTVAYGLSFERGQLASFDLPKTVEKPPAERIWQPHLRRKQMVSKDDV
jgi:hypothetical protein